MLAQFFRGQKTSQVSTSPNACRVLKYLSSDAARHRRCRFGRKFCVHVGVGIRLLRQVSRSARSSCASAFRTVGNNHALSASACVCGFVWACGREYVYACACVCVQFVRPSLLPSFVLTRSPPGSCTNSSGWTDLHARHQLSPAPPGAPSKHLPNSVGLSAQDKESEAFEKIYGCHHGVPFTAVNGPDEGPATPTP
jgi:hypothetical protein